MSDWIGQHLGNYQLSRLLGKGGFAEVYLAHHRYLNTPAAIKILTLQIERSTRDLILREARTCARLDHPHINRVLEFGLQEETPYLVMDYAPGGSLRQLHPRGTTLTLERILYYVQQIADALQYAHDHRIIHRDIKPENILLGKRNEMLLSDFGIAIAAHDTQTLSDQEKAGTARYMAPEQSRGKARAASDQYALAVMVYEWLTGYPPFTGSSALEIALKHLQQDVPPLTKHNVSWVDDSTLPALAPVVMKALAKDPKQRFPSVSAFAHALDEACSEWIRPKRGTVIAVYHPHASYVDALAWAPHGRLLASGSDDATVQIWNPWRGRCHAAYLGHQRCIHGVCWSPDAMRVASAADDQTVQIWEADTGKQLLTYRGHRDNVEALAWSPDGEYLASSSAEKAIHVWRASTGECLVIYRGHADGGPDSMGLPALAWSPDGNYLASAGDYYLVHVWNASTGKRITLYRGHKDDATTPGSTINTLAWSPDGTMIASGGWDHTVHVWHALTGKQLFIYRGHTSGVECVAWSPDGSSLASAGVDETVQLWVPISGKLRFTFRSHRTTIHALAWSPDGDYLASSDTYGYIAIWKAR